MANKDMKCDINRRHYSDDTALASYSFRLIIYCFNYQFADRLPLFLLLFMRVNLIAFLDLFLFANCTFDSDILFNFGK